MGAHFPLWALAAVDISFACVALALSFEDFRRGAVPLWLLWVFAGVGILSRVLHGGGSLLVWLPATLLALTFGILYLVRPGKMGLADVWVAPSLGLFVSLESVAYALLISCGGALLYLVGVYIHGRMRQRVIHLRGTRVPFIPFLVLGFTATFLLEKTLWHFTYP